MVKSGLEDIVAGPAPDVRVNLLDFGTVCASCLVFIITVVTFVSGRLSHETDPQTIMRARALMT